MFPSRVELTEVGARDGLQALSPFVPTEQKIALIESFAASGLPRIEASSFVSPRAVPQLADAAEVVAAAGRLGPIVSALVPNEKGAMRAVQAGADEMVTFISASESHSRANLNRSIAEAIRAVEPVARIAQHSGKRLRSAIAVAFGCPFEDEVAPAKVSEIAGALRAFGIREITLGDTTGMAAPKHVEAVCERLRSDWPDLVLTLHFHDTRGLGLVNLLTGLRLGVDKYEAATGAVGGCPFAPGATGNICTEDVVYMLSELGVETGIDLEAAIASARLLERILGRKLPGKLLRAGPRTQLHALDAVRHAVG